MTQVQYSVLPGLQQRLKLGLPGYLFHADRARQPQPSKLQGKETEFGAGQPQTLGKYQSAIEGNPQRNDTVSDKLGRISGPLGVSGAWR